MEEQTQPTKRRQATQIGTVSSLSGDKTIRVTVATLAKHPIYSKYMRRHTKLAVHDADNVAAMGDTVEIVPCRRLSKRKSWRLVRVLHKADFVEPPTGEEDK